MPEELDVQVRHGAFRGSVLVEPLPSDGLFRVLVHPVISEEFDFDDVVELRSYGPDLFDFVRVVERSPLARQEWVLSKAVALSQGLRQLGAEVIEAGGYWELALGGVFFVALPADSAVDPEARLDALFCEEAE